MSPIKLKGVLLIAVRNYNASSNNNIPSKTIARKIVMNFLTSFTAIT